MKIRRLDKNGDWTFGQGVNNYAQKDEAIVQNAVTRVKEFRNDWLWDVTTGIDWDNILSNKNTPIPYLKKEVERVLTESEGVKSVDNIDINVVNRQATITIHFTTVYEKSFTREIGIS